LYRIYARDKDIDYYKLPQWDLVGCNGSKLEEEPSYDIML
jgi:hypothetical protein